MRVTTECGLLMVRAPRPYQYYEITDLPLNCIACVSSQLEWG